MRSGDLGFDFPFNPNERIVGVDLPIEEAPPTREIVFAALDYYENWLNHYMHFYCRAKDAGRHRKAAAHMAKITRLDTERMIWRQALGYALVSPSAAPNQRNGDFDISQFDDFPPAPVDLLPAAFFADDEAGEAAQ